MFPTSASCSDGSCRDCRWACTMTPVQRSRAISRMAFHSCCRYFCRSSASGRSGTGAEGELEEPRSAPGPCHRSHARNPSYTRSRPRH